MQQTNHLSIWSNSPCTFFVVVFWQNPDIVLVHYLNVPAIEDCGKPCGPILCSINTDKKEWAKWTKEELIGQLKPMCECWNKQKKLLVQSFTLDFDGNIFY